MEISIFILLTGIIFGFAVSFLFRFPVNKPLVDKSVKHTIVNAKYEKEVLTLYLDDNSEIKLSGYCTVWYKLPEFTRLDYSGGNLCYNIVEQLKYIKKSGSKFSPIDIDFDL